ncbi:MAG: DUF481 domain-containing protein [Akkermansiaceae bacterium]|jgi:putative salt-induced outer membrane protein|nr:DUF481 domain-containing protein [Akkermansiaceae bacterium]
MFKNLAVLVSFTLIANTPPLSADTPTRWDNTAAAGISLAQGNSDNLSYNLRLLSLYEHNNIEAKIGVDWNYAENNDTKNIDSFRAFSEYRYLLSDHAYLGTNASYLIDDITDIDYRIDLGVVAGYYLLKNKDQKLSFEAGPGYVWQDQANVTDDYMTLRFALRYAQQLAAQTKLSFTTTFTPAVNDFSDHLLSAEAGIDTAINDHWAIRTAIRYQYDSTPAPNRQSSDTLLTLGLRYTLGSEDTDHTSGEKSSSPAESGAISGPEAIQDGWTSTAALTLSMADGNSDNLNTAASYDAAHRSDTGEFFFTSAYNYAEADNTASADSVVTRTQFNKLLTRNTYLGIGLGFLRDDIADIDYRVTPAITLGHYFIKKDHMTLSLEAGPGFTFEKVNSTTDNYFSIVGGEKFIWEINKRISLKQSLTGHINPSNTDDFNIAAEIALDTDISKHLAWRIAASWSYDNTPASNNDKDDITLSSGITVKF